MAKRGISILKGIEAQTVIDLLNKAYCDEWLKNSNCSYDAPSNPVKQ